jgi:hypothetical protein
MLNELKETLHKPSEFQSTIGLRSDFDDSKHRDHLSLEEKVVLYGHQFHRYREYLQQARQPAKLIISIAPGNSSTKAAPAPVVGAAVGSGLEQQILESISKPGQKKARSLFKHLNNSKVLTWTAEGEISYRGRPIPQSNTVDLMTDAQRLKPMKHRKLLPGFDEFAQALKETNTAKAWSTNLALIKAMEKPGRSVRLNP